MTRNCASSKSLTARSGFNRGPSGSTGLYHISDMLFITMANIVTQAVPGVALGSTGVAAPT